MTEKTAVYQDDKLIGYCDQMSLKSEFDNIHYKITGFVPIDHQPAFAIGEYYLDKDVNRIVKIENHQTGYTEIKYLFDGKLQNSVLYNLADYFETWEPATAEQIATFLRAEHFASKGRKLDEFSVGDSTNIGVVIKVIGDRVTIHKGNGLIVEIILKNYGKTLIKLIRTAEELQEVGDE